MEEIFKLRLDMKNCYDKNREKMRLITNEAFQLKLEIFNYNLNI